MIIYILSNVLTCFHGCRKIKRRYVNAPSDVELEEKFTRKSIPQLLGDAPWSEIINANIGKKGCVTMCPDVTSTSGALILFPIIYQERIYFSIDWYFQYNMIGFTMFKPNKTTVFGHVEYGVSTPIAFIDALQFKTP